ncbi:hypothetical protein NUU61_002249 [Penicillium alfredii]|uniref:Uncharacterized protein n=1 Tax=Penicillium alfredii TaxID=1506179 RepID=A0A9W9FRW8_9EURO|nr:uncharacterized protein NUU61_002249 [Penicillium alfredii]KAJ5104902.1 hypothetical protein NUU61_002249 [Penicillium alfredii]
MSDWDNGYRSLLRYLNDIVKIHPVVTLLVEATLGCVIGKVHDVYKGWYERLMRPEPARTWYGT